VLLFNHSDIRLQEFLIDSSFPSPDMLRALWKLLKDQPQLGKLAGDELEARLRRELPGAPSGAAVSAAIRILERHGMLSRDDEKLAATRPTPGVFPTFDVASLQRRADIERRKLRTMIDYAYHPRCRRQYILEYFGDAEWLPRDRRCGACDNCEAVAQGKTVGLAPAEVTAVRNLLSLVGSLNGRFGRMRVAGIATGSDDDGRFQDMPERGCLRGWSQQHILDLIRALEGAGLVEASRGEYPTLSTTRRGDLVAIGKADTEGLQMPTMTKRRVRKRKR